MITTSCIVYCVNWFNPDQKVPTIKISDFILTLNNCQNTFRKGQLKVLSNCQIMYSWLTNQILSIILLPLICTCDTIYSWWLVIIHWSAFKLIRMSYLFMYNWQLAVWSSDLIMLYNISVKLKLNYQMYWAWTKSNWDW